MKNYILSIIALALVSVTTAQQLAFPTAKGAGAFNTGGTNGQIIKVSNLNANGPGSFIEAINTTGPRVIIFDVGGTIDLRTETGYYDGLIENYVSGHNDVTIMGQTAPGGITIETHFTGFTQTENIVVRYLRSKHVDLPTRLSDGASMTGAKIMLDHCTFIGGDDEVLSIYDYGRVSTMEDVTVQRNMFANGKTGMILGGVYHNYNIDPAGSPQDLINNQFTVLNNLWVDISHRFPNASVKGGGSYDIINNVIYNANLRINSLGATTSSPYNSANADMHMKYNWIGNYIYNSNRILTSGYGPGLDDNQNEIQEWDFVSSINPTNVEIYSANNVSTGVFDTPQVNDWYFWQNFDFGSYDYNTLKSNAWFTTTQHPLLGQGYTITSAAQAYTDVMADVGANAYLDDNHQKVNYTETLEQIYRDRVVNDSSTEFGGFDSGEMIYGNHTGFTRPANWDDDNDGMPDTWEVTTFGDTTSQSSWGDHDSDGIPNLYEYTNLIDGTATIIDVTGVTVTPSNISINIPETTTLLSTISPVDASNQSGVWSSAHPAIATVDQNGIVTPVSIGDATITFTANDTTLGTFTDSTVVTVTNTTIDLISVALSPSGSTLTNLDSFTMTSTPNPLNATDVTGVWSSSDTGVATIDSSGIVQPLTDGSFTITFNPTDPNAPNATENFTVSLPTGATVTSRINSGFGDIKETVAGGNAYNSDVEIPYDIGFEPLINGFYFTNLNIPTGKTIVSAFITFTASNSNTGAVDTVIYGEANNNPAIFDGTTSDVGSRTQTTANVTWSIPNTTAEQTYNTPDLKTIVQERIDAVGYNSANPMVFFATHVSGTNSRLFYSFNYDELQAPLLTVIYDDNGSSIPVTGISVSPSNATAFPGDYIPFTVTITPANATNKTFVLSTDTANFATKIDDTTFEMVYDGDPSQAVIRATANDTTNGTISNTTTVDIELPVLVQAIIRLSKFSRLMIQN